MKIPGLFVTGTGTEIGKTRVSARIAASLAANGVRVGVYKPVASGCRLQNGSVLSDDALELWQAARRPGPVDRVCPQRFLAPLAPHLAAAAEGKTIDLNLLRNGLSYWLDRSDFVIVEGIGGLMSPLSEDLYVADLAAEFQYPLIVVAPNALGVINQVLQTLITAVTFGEGIPVAGIVLNHLSAPHDEDPSVATNRREIEARAVPPVVAELPYQADQFDRDVDWIRLARSWG